MPFHRDILRLEPRQEVERIAGQIRRDVLETLKCRGAVLGVSGGIDSAVVLALCVAALEQERVIALLLPERESSPDSARLARQVCRHFGVPFIVEDVTAALLGFGCYQRRDQAVAALFPEFDSTHKSKITLPGNLLESDALNVFSATIVNPEGEVQSRRLRPEQLRQIVAASNFKQRTRMAMLYYHAELRNYAVIGTPPKNEHDLGFFVKHGDGAMDVKPIGHLYKSQVYQLATYLGVPEEIQKRPPTSDTYSAGSTQEEFYYRLPFEMLDLVWFAWEHHVDESDAARVVGCTPEQVRRVYRDLSQKIRTTEPLRTPPLGADGRSPTPVEATEFESPAEGVSHSDGDDRARGKA